MANLGMPPVSGAHMSSVEPLVEMLSRDVSAQHMLKTVMKQQQEQRGHTRAHLKGLQVQGALLLRHATRQEVDARHSWRHRAQHGLHGVLGHLLWAGRGRVQACSKALPQQLADVALIASKQQSCKLACEHGLHLREFCQRKGPRTWQAHVGLQEDARQVNVVLIEQPASHNVLSRCPEAAGTAASLHMA